MTTKFNKKTDNRISIPQEFGKIPPQALELEEVVLGATILEPRAYYLINTILSPESFYKEEHIKIFTAIEDLASNRSKIDMLTVQEQLKKNGHLEDIGGPAYVTLLTLRVGSSAHIEDHALIIQQKFIARKIIEISSEAQNRAFDESYDIKFLLDYLQRELNNLIKRGISKKARSLGKIGAEVMDDLSALSKSKVEFSGVPSGFTKVDRHTSGWQKSDLIIIAARPSMGKTYLALKLAINACKLKFRVLVFSLEMSDKQIYHRELSNETGIENSRIRKANFTDQEWEAIGIAQGKFEKYELYIDDTPAISISEFRAKCMLYKIEYGIDLILVDYIQLMKSPKFSDNKNREIGDISNNLKATAKDIDVPIIALSQLSRKVDERTSKKPVLSDLRETGELEQDADIVIFIHRPEYYGIKETEDGENTKNLMELIFAKHRNGATGTIKLWKNTNWTELNDFLPGEEMKDSKKPDILTDDLPF